jgi:hypothetical protein
VLLYLSLVLSSLHSPFLPLVGIPPSSSWLRTFLAGLAVEFVRVLADERVAMVKYASSEGARRAVELNGTELLGEILHVRQSPPLPLLTP